MDKRQKQQQHRKRERGNATKREEEADCHDSSFLQRAYPAMKSTNPSIPILIREAQGTSPRMYARFGTNPADTHTCPHRHTHYI